MKPLVSIICISYNHERYIIEALKSVFDQSYENLEIIICDDSSTDSSQQVIRDFVAGKENIKLQLNSSNIGYTSTFNQAFDLSKGDYIVDFALDDVMHAEFISKSVEQLQKVDAECGVCFSNANYINESSDILANHNEELRKKGLLKEVPHGDVFEEILKRYFICTPTMMIHRSVLERLNGYDSDLEFEDFDFWVRSSRFTKYTYLDEVLMSKRKVKTSMSAFQYDFRRNHQLQSTLIVCHKAHQLCKTNTEFQALRERVRHELGHCITSGASELAGEFFELLKSLKESTFRLMMYKTLLVLKLDYRFLNKKRKKGLL